MQSQAEPTHSKYCPFNTTQSPNLCDCGESDRLLAEVRRALVDADMLWEEEMSRFAKPPTYGAPGQSSQSAR